MSAVRAVVVHDRRLEILDCLDGGEPMTMAQLGRELGRPRGRLDYHLGRLDAHGLVSRGGIERGPAGVERRYAVRLDELPEWVRQAVEDWRQKNRPD